MRIRCLLIDVRFPIKHDLNLPAEALDKRIFTRRSTRGTPTFYVHRSSLSGLPDLRRGRRETIEQGLRVRSSAKGLSVDDGNNSKAHGGRRLTGATQAAMAPLGWGTPTKTFKKIKKTNRES